jgi:crossover junction endodeoxyribonuclease RuvC
MKSIHVLGVDPGLANFGWTVVKFEGSTETLIDMGVVRTEKSDKKKGVLASDENFDRTREIAKVVIDLCEQYQVAAICAEAMSYPRSSSAAAKMAMTWGILATISQIRTIPFTQASPQQIKKFLCGKKDASKEEVEAVVLKRWPNAAEILDAKKIARSYREHAYDSAATIIGATEHSEVIRVVRQLFAA